MRTVRLIILGIVILLGIYAASMYYLVDESKSFRVEKELNYPVEKVFPQFSNLQNFAKWNHFFASSKTMQLDFYTPYEGKGASLSYADHENDRSGELFVRYHNPNRTMRYQIFENGEKFPTHVDIKFIRTAPEKTKIIWNVQTPKKALLERAANFWTEDRFGQNLDKSIISLTNYLSNKVEKDQFLTDIKYDSIITEKLEGQLVLGINVSSSNKKDALYKNIIMNHNKVKNFAQSDLGKSEDEVGFPVLITAPGNLKDKEISYFIGVPVNRREGISDNSFSYRTVNESEAYSVYYKGSYADRGKIIQQLIQKAKKDIMRNGDLQQVFLEAPEENKNVLMKISIPVYR